VGSTRSLPPLVGIAGGLPPSPNTHPGRIPSSPTGSLAGHFVPSTVALVGAHPRWWHRARDGLVLDGAVPAWSLLWVAAPSSAASAEVASSSARFAGMPRGLLLHWLPPLLPPLAGVQLWPQPSVGIAGFRAVLACRSSRPLVRWI